MIDEKDYELLCQDLFPLFRRIPSSPKYAITLGGSHGKGLSDKRSDFDFRVYYYERVDGEEWQNIIKELHLYMDKWKKRGVEIDGVWPRSIKEVDDMLNDWILGKAVPEPREWSIWGYHLLTDIYNQAIIEDPFDIALGWKKKLAIYPKNLKACLLKKHCSSLDYWRKDYHYYSKVLRQDTVFLASISARIVHDIMQIIYALNDFYFPGDGLNLKYISNFQIKPDRLEERIIKILYPGVAPNCYEQQYKDILQLIDNVLELCI